MSNEATPTPGASEDDQAAVETATPGASADGGAGGTDSSASGGDAFAAERERLQASTRELQAAKDREAARAAKLEQELAQLRAGNDGGSATAGQTLDPKALAREVFAESQKLASLNAAAESFKATYKYADESIFATATEYASVEALEAAAKASHERVATAVEAEADAKVQAALEEASAKYGFQLKTPAAPPETPSGEPTLDQWAAMSMDEQDALEAEYPGIGDRILRSAYERG